MPHPLSLEMLGAKTCPRCQKRKAPDAFYPGKCVYCKPCSKEYAREWRRDNPAAKAKAKAYAAEKYWEGRHRPTKEERVEKARLTANAQKRRYDKANRDKVNEKKRAYFARNPGKRLAKSAIYRAKRRQRLPAWADRAAIRAIYEACPPGHHVDHIIPLGGENVSGLHVAANLQYLPAEENIAKGNAF